MGPINTVIFDFEGTLMNGAAPFAGLEPMLAGLHKDGLRLAIVTSSGHHVHDILAHHKLDRYFTSIVHAERVNRSKPDPEGVLIAMAECASLPSEAIMIGDSPNDIFAGKNAGARFTIGITHGDSSRSGLQAAGPDYIVSSPAELPALLQKLCKQ